MGPGRMVAFAEPLGSSSHRSLGLFGLADADPLPMISLDEVVSTVEATPGLLGVVPVETVLEGELAATLDRLVDARVLVVGEAVLAEPIWAFGADAGASAHVVISHPAILALAAGWIAATGAEVREALSTRHACQEVALAGPGLVALAPPEVGYQAELIALEDSVTSIPEVRTRYVLIGHELPAPTGDDRSRLVVVPRADVVGVLAEITSVLAAAGVNLTSIVSRPLGLGDEHYFLIGTRGHAADPGLEHALGELARLGHRVRLLGSYPRWQGPEVVVPRPTPPSDGLAHDG
ncbi:prephenate dehydratase [Acidimicrobium ferrooxidans DSM 10331]|uniref:Prephenate dehydratase n=1 Tax=Acidimicrobium ferrooxidans (strain DSM 10331 / JCM 15462 / NBRC 103882 / ICP) TaxID=525909 RepID=C7LZD3_ACIFD|nr:prephenate dehydratase domain-containing protein [Acidimicrobium ferrooxidans]ACU54091.1 prephenate dehydratase [Acidimicrobium ferrooxidans DSM 10331]